MFIGHYAIALAAKKGARKVSLGTFILAAQFLDMLWPPLLLLGVEHVRIAPGITAFSPLDLYDYPISHSLLMSLVWSLLVGGIYHLFGRDKKGALVVGACVFSHWVLDFLTHRPDMPLMPGRTEYVGLGLWNSIPATIIVESALFLAGIILYVRTTKAVDATGKYGFWAFIGFLSASYVISIKSLSKVGDVDSASEYICTSGRIIARVQLRGTAVKLGKAAGKKK